MEVRVGEDGQQRQVRHGEEAVEQGEGDEAREHEVVGDEAETFDELGEHALAGAGGGRPAKAQAAVEGERGVGGEGGQPEPDGAAECRDQNPRDRRADHATGLPRNGAEGDGIGQAIALDELRHEGHAARLVEGPEGVAHGREHEQVLEADDT